MFLRVYAPTGGRSRPQNWLCLAAGPSFPDQQRGNWLCLAQLPRVRPTHSTGQLPRHESPIRNPQSAIAPTLAHPRRRILEWWNDGMVERRPHWQPTTVNWSSAIRHLLFTLSKELCCVDTTPSHGRCKAESSRNPQILRTPIEKPSPPCPRRRHPHHGTQPPRRRRSNATRAGRTQSPNKTGRLFLSFSLSRSLLRPIAGYRMEARARDGTIVVRSRFRIEMIADLQGRDRSVE